MKLIAHRGWSAGGDENTLATFAPAARDDRIAGVEFDVCHAVDAMTLVVSHDPPLHIENTLTLDAALSFLSQTDLELFVEIKETGLASVVIEKLVSSNVADRSVVFAFAAVARSFPWEGCATGAPDGLHMNDWSYGCMANLLASAIADASTRVPQAAGITAASSAERCDDGSRSSGQDSFDNRVSVAASKCPLIRNTYQYYADPRINP